MLSEFKQAFSRPNNSHLQLILINVAIFLFLVVLYVFSFFGGFEFVFGFVYDQFSIPSNFKEFITRPWTIITYAFAHDYTRILHILGNMLGLYWFGKLFIEYLGSDKLIAVYVLGALSGAIIYLLAFNTIPKLAEFPSGGMVGASGAVFAVMVATATLLPDYTFFLIFLGPVRIKYIALFFIVGSLIGTTSTNAGGNLAHLGGAFMGYIYTKQLQAGVNWGGWITQVILWVKGLGSSKSRVKVTYRKNDPKPFSSETKVGRASQQEIDAILDKISDKGYESLSKDEKEKLFNASKK
jgi:membrane associated rhomboid family serine protease